jgi:TetR/AcrR family transcriptional repressor of nem operon
VSAKAEKKERSHGAILDAAARLLRSGGAAGASVAEVMSAAGLTVGGFYAHFASKDELVAEALARCEREMCERLLAGLEDWAPPDRVEMILRRYLSRTHREDVEGGCALPSLLSDVVTRGTCRDALAREISTLADAIEPHHPALPSSPRRQRALAAIALMVGGLSLSRALRGTPLSDEILKACRAYGRAAMRGYMADAPDAAP